MVMPFPSKHKSRIWKGSVGLIFAAGLSLIVLVSDAIAQPVSVQALVNETNVGTEERVVYTIEVKGSEVNEVATPQPPAADNLTITQRYPSTQRSVSIINGSMSQTISFTWAYRPNGKGMARIHPADVTVDGKKFQTRALTLNVVAQANRPKANRQGAASGNPPSFFDGNVRSDERIELSDRDLFIRAVPNTRQAYVGSQIIIEYQLYFRDGIRLRQSRLADSWDAAGFWREEMDVDTNPVPRTVVENGLRYNVITLKRVAAFPTRAGALRIDPLRIETEAYVPYRSSDPFDSFFGMANRFDIVKVNSPPVNITALALPDGAPDSFTGAVGTFRQAVQIDRTSASVGGSVQLNVTLSGTGNVATLDKPVYKAPGAFDLYDPQVKTSINRNGSLISGSKTFVYVLVPRSNGVFELPPVVFSFFNPSTRRYETIELKPGTIRVTGTPNNVASRNATGPGLPADDIAGPMESSDSWRETGGHPIFASPWTYTFLLIPLLLLLASTLAHQRSVRLSTDVEYARSRRAHPLARKHLRKAEVLLDSNQPGLFYEEIERAVLGFVGNRLNVAERGFTRPQLELRLESAGIPETERSELRILLDRCDQIRFAPILPTRDEMQQDVQRAGNLIVRIDQAFRTRPVSVDA